MFLYSGNCVYVLIVEFRLYLSLSLLSLSLYYRTELVSNGKNVCCSSIQSQRNWICIVSYPRQRNSFLTPILTEYLSGNLSGQNIVPYQILAYFIEKLPIYSLPPFGNSRRNLLYILDEAKANSTLSTIRQIFSHMHATL